MEVFAVMEGWEAGDYFDFEYELVGVFRTFQEASKYCGSKRKRSLTITMKQYLEERPTLKEGSHFLIIRTNLGE